MTGKSDPQLAALRRRIDEIDDRIVDLLNARAEAALEIGVLKAKRSQRAHAPQRERQILERLTVRSRGPMSADSLRLIYKEIFSASLSLERTARGAR